MPSVSVRPADHDDLACMQRLRSTVARERGHVIDGVPGAPLANILEGEDPRVIVAEGPDAIVGWGAAFLLDSPIGVMYLDPTRPSTPACRALMVDLEQVADEAGVKALPLVII